MPRLSYRLVVLKLNEIKYSRCRHSHGTVPPRRRDTAWAASGMMARVSIPMIPDLALRLRFYLAPALIFS